MTDSEAPSADTGSPRASTSSKWRRIIARRMPRRRWVGSTEMAVRPPTGMPVRPGRVSSSESAPPVPTMRSPSKAAMLRSNSKPRWWSAISSSPAVSPKTIPMTRVNSAHCSAATGPISMSIPPLYSKPRRRTPAFRPTRDIVHCLTVKSRQRAHGSPDRAWRRAGVSPLANKETRGNGAGLPGCRLRKPDRAGDRGRRRRRGGVLQARLAAAEVAVPRQAQRQGLAAPMEAPARPGVASQADGAGTAPRPGGRRERLWAFLELFALVGFAIAQPTLDVLGKAPDFFIFRQADRADILVLVLAVTVLPALGIWLVELVAGLAGERARRSVHLLMVTGLLVLLALVLLLASPVSKLMLPQPGGEVNANSPDVRIRAEHPVVMLLLDEFPLTSLLDSKGEIDRRLYPNFAKLAGGSTWYRNATAVSGLTEFAVPALLDGRYPRESLPPTAASYPDNLFTLLAKSYAVEPFQVVTQLCPAKTCKATAATAPTAVGLQNTLRDSARVFKRVAWPQDVDENPTGAWLNATTAEKTKRPAPAAGNGPASKVLKEIDEGNEPDQYRNFVAAIQGSDRPTFYFLHILMPHQPWHWLPDGKKYPDHGDGRNANGWTSEAWPPQLTRQRHLMQTGEVDRMIGQNMRR